MMWRTSGHSGLLETSLRFILLPPIPVPGPEPWTRLHGGSCRVDPLLVLRLLGKGVSEAPSDQRTARICGILPPSGAALQPGLWAPLLTWLKGGVRVLSGEHPSRAGPSFCLQSSWIRLQHSGWQVNLQSRGRESKGWVR